MDFLIFPITHGIPDQVFEWHVGGRFTNGALVGAVETKTQCAHAVEVLPYASWAIHQCQVKPRALCTTEEP
eukprot:5662251-Amphidinium_carterae.2